jgi:hypothetical protein
MLQILPVYLFIGSITLGRDNGKNYKQPEFSNGAATYAAVAAREKLNVSRSKKFSKRLAPGKPVALPERWLPHSKLLIISTRSIRLDISKVDVTPLCILIPMKHGVCCLR